jgi:hypothetical protein
VAYFRDTEELYELLGRFFAELVDDPELADRFRSADTIIQYRYSDPEAQITITLLEDEPAEVAFGETLLDPEVVLSSTADIAHRFWLGKLNVGWALARGQIKTTGPVAKVVKIGPAAKAAGPRYRALLEAAGRSDLLA